MAAAPSLPDNPAPPGPEDGDPERVWLRDVYKPGVRQLTTRAVISGMVIGGVMCLSNLYVVLKTGWSLGVTVTACVLAYGAFRALSAARVVKGHFSILENNAMGSVASAAGYMTGGGNMAAIPALFMLTGALPSAPWLIMWFAVIAALGVFAAIPIKRQLINIEKLPFPTGIATAETLKSLHVEENDAAGDGKSKARWLFGSAAIGAIVAVLRDAKAAFIPFNLPGKIFFPFSWGGHAAKDWSLALEGSFIYVGAGGIIGLRTCGWMLVGAIGCYGFLAPWLVGEGVIQKVEYKTIVNATLWPAAALMLAHGLTAFSFQWRSVVKSFSGLAGLFRKQAATGTRDPLEEVECPSWWFPGGFLVLGPVVVFLMWFLFGIPGWAALIALPLSVVMGIVASRVTGETDVTPTKALGPATQLIYGAVLPGNLPANIMGANVTGGVGLHAADLLTDLKSGYLLGANPRQQFIAQLFGVVAGALVVVPVFRLLVPEASVLGGEEFPAPGVQVWAGVSKILVEGVSTMPSIVRWLTLVGAVLGLGLALIERWIPKSLSKYVPSAPGLSIALVVPGANAVTMCLGAVIAEATRKANPKLAARSVVAASSGLIAGESLLGIAVKGLVVAGVLDK
ncbi:MAG: OPT/YSL family transporter [Polyangiaceae bacterium]|nr:OPT/YSL family transporter [Polyangiaceae bacterium]